MESNTSFWTNRRVLVTGGASFIGSHLVERLIGQGAYIRVVDDLSSGKLENLSAVINQIDFTKGDLRIRAVADAACRNQEIVFHLAASHGGRGYIDTHPVECVTNMILDGTVMAAAHAAGIERICFTSSACIYPTHLQAESGQERTVYLREEWGEPFSKAGASPDGEYGWAKLSGEITLGSYCKQHGMKGVSCRLFTAYGERENETHAVIALIAKAFIKMDPYEIWGNGEQDRNFTYVGDIAEGMIHACEKITDGSSINVGTGEHISINATAEAIFEITGFRPRKINHDLTKPVGVFSRAADLTRARTVLGWEPRTSFREGLARTIDWYYRNNDATVKEHLKAALMER